MSTMTVHIDKRRSFRNPVACPVYYSDGDFHASGMTENLTSRGGCLRGTHAVTVGMQLLVLLIRPSQEALLVKKATVRWVGDEHFGVELSEEDSGPVGELDEADLDGAQGTVSYMTH